jgi:outer membrane protein OmpA-like peptidoglycan-associated protein
MRWRSQGEPTRDATPEPAAPEAGRPLEPTVRGRMESRLGHDFGNVRVHHRPEQAQALHARAFTVGEDVTFAPGQYAPETAQGDRLLAHELGHVVDHRAGAPLGAYRAPEGETIPSGPERALPVPASVKPTLAAGSLSLGIGTLDGFAFNGDELTPDHRKQIPRIVDALVTLMGKMPGGRVTVVGHTDLVGGEQANLDLGRKRALSVAAALAVAGIPRAMIDFSSAGASAPVVQSAGKEPRNRRAEIRFAGAPIGEGAQLQPPGATPPVPFKPFQPTVPGGPGTGTLPGFGLPGKAPPQQTPGTLQPGQPEPQTKPGSPGDIAKAVAAVPEVKKLLEDAEARGRKDLGKLSTPDKVVLGTVTGAIAAGAVAGIFSDATARGAALDFVDGKEIPVPGLPGVSVVPHTKGGAIGGGVSFDIIKIFGGGKK